MPYEFDHFIVTCILSIVSKKLSRMARKMKNIHIRFLSRSNKHEDCLDKLRRYMLS